MSHEEPKTVTIYVNSRSESWPKGKIGYDDVVAFYLQGKPRPANARYTIVYSKGSADHPTGKLNPGGSVEVKDGMQFDVDQTIES
jgi:hypothetical protein